MTDREGHEVDASSQPEATRKGRVRRALRAVGATTVGTVVLLLLLEVVLRPVAYFAHGRSDYYLFYGFHSAIGRVGISPWTVYTGHHFKFPPNFELRDAAGQGEETAHTNSLGFRGPDFDPVKPGGTFRIVCLGGSSTFGFHNTDEGTYPYFLQRLYEEEPAPLRVEVINAGFPYYNTGTIRELLEQEIVRYDPDLITLYTAYNDVGWPTELSPLMRALIWVQQHSIVYLVAKETVLTDNDVYRLKSKVARVRDVRPDRERRSAQIERVARRYRDNLESIIDFATRRGIRVVLIRQPMTTRTNNRRPNELTYEQEYEVVRRKFENGEFMRGFEGQMLGHRRLIDELDRIAAERGLPVVDNIAIVDRNRNLLSSWVHLTEEANLLLAREIKRTIDPLIAGASQPPAGAAPPGGAAPPAGAADTSPGAGAAPPSGHAPR